MMGSTEWDEIAVLEARLARSYISHGGQPRASTLRVVPVRCRHARLT